MSKTYDNIARLRIQFKDENNNNKVLLTHKYEWNTDFDTLVAVECE